MSKEKRISIIIDDALKRNRKSMRTFLKQKAELDKAVKRVLKCF